MSVFDKAKDRAEQMIGRAKERLGRNTDDVELENAGKRDQLKGEAKETVHDVRDDAAAAVRDAQRRVLDDDDRDRH